MSLFLLITYRQNGQLSQFTKRSAPPSICLRKTNGSGFGISKHRVLSKTKSRPEHYFLPIGMNFNLSKTCSVLGTAISKDGTFKNGDLKSPHKRKITFRSIFEIIFLFQIELITPINEIYEKYGK
ncbi:hypothetical protein TMES_20100 [Thalassospira mesophila]|uniref:Uncharacterized protein n=1 Tax=Thalassospira mesophila TaxID=1293891 RepID=A0A1Y2KVZ7_9PROT|nr:hypothetical protein TMES_20100 [Thalassospira mesophila]